MKITKKAIYTAIIIFIIGILCSCSTIKGLLKDFEITIGVKQTANTEANDTTQTVSTDTATIQRGGE